MIGGSNSVGFIAQTQMLEDGRLLAVGSFNKQIGVERVPPDQMACYQFISFGAVVKKNVGNGLHAKVKTVDKYG